jgi:hypothetical protein
MKSRDVLLVDIHCILKFRDISTRFYHGYYETLQQKIQSKSLFSQAKRLMHIQQGWPDRQTAETLNLGKIIRQRVTL